MANKLIYIISAGAGNGVFVFHRSNRNLTPSWMFR